MALAKLTSGGGFLQEIAGGAINHVEHQVRFGDFAVASFNSLVLHRFVRFPKTGGIGEAEHGFFVNEALFNIVAGGAGHVADYGPFMTEKGIEKSGFSGVWPAGNNSSNAFCEEVSFAV